jgi:capsular exopolysaccharide synthesis family protein
VQEAVVPPAPISPNVPRNVALAVVLGTVLGVGAAMAGQTLDTSVRGEADVRAISGVPVLGTIAHDPEAASHPLIVQADPHSARAEAFRHLRTNLQFVDAAGNACSFVMTSSLTGEGKSTATANLALTLAAAGVRVCVVEGDLRRPKVAEYLGLDNSVGLTTTLIGQAHLHDVIQPWGDGTLDLLAAGRLPPNPSELLGSAAMEGALRKLESLYDVVLIDAPPLLPVTDAAVLSRVAGGAVVVVGSGKVTRDQLTKALASLDAVGARMLGVLLNFVPATGSDAYSYRYYAQ